MKFGKVDNPEDINFAVPQDTNRPASHPTGELHVFAGCCKWNKADLKNFYPPGTTDELAYYSTQFNSSHFVKWREATAYGFKFFPKIWHDISHWNFLKDVDDKIENFVANSEKLQRRRITCEDDLGKQKTVKNRNHG